MLDRAPATHIPALAVRTTLLTLVRVSRAATRVTNFPGETYLDVVAVPKIADKHIFRNLE